MKEYFDKINRIILDTENYKIFFENPHEKGHGPDFEQLGEIFFGFTFMKLLDLTLKNIKIEVLEKYEKNKDSNNLHEILLNTATYSDGEIIGFYNTSKYDLTSICLSKSNEELLQYIDGFSFNVKELLNKMNFKEHINFLVKYDVLSSMLNAIYLNPLNIECISTKEELTELFEYLLNYLSNDEYFLMGLEKIVNDDPYTSYYYIHDSINQYGEFLNNLLLNDLELGIKDSYKIYDPNSSGAYILHKTKNGILKNNPNAGIELYGKTKRIENESISLSKEIITKHNPYTIDDATILKDDENLFKIKEINSYHDFDLIISNYINCQSKEFREIFEIFKNKNPKKIKLVMAIDSINPIRSILSKAVANDNLESIIHFKNHHIVILNTNKPTDKKGKLIFIDKSERDEGEISKIEMNREMFTNNNFEIFNLLSSTKLSEYDLNQMDEIIESYKYFKENNHSKIIENKDYNEELVELLIL